MHLQGPPNLHMAAEVFPSPQASIEGTFVNPQLIAPADRALFCPVSSHWVFQVLMRRRQKAKNPLSTSLQGSAEHPSPHIGHALFCPVSHWVFRILTRHRQGTKNHLSHLSIDQACCHCFDYYPIDRRRRGMSQPRFGSDSEYINHPQAFFLPFFFPSSSSSSWRLSIASRMLLNESYWRMTTLNSRWLSVHERQTCRPHGASTSLKEDSVTMQTRVGKTACNDPDQKRINGYQVLMPRPQWAGFGICAE